MHLCVPESQKWGLDAPFAFVIIIFIVIYFSCVSRVCHKNDQVWLAERGRDENNLNWERWIAPIRKPYQKNISWKILYAVLSHTWSLFLLHCNERHSLNLNSFDDEEYFQTFRFSFKNKLNTFFASRQSSYMHASTWLYAEFCKEYIYNIVQMTNWNFAVNSFMLTCIAIVCT